MKRIKDAGFRELYQKYIYIDCIDLMKQLVPEEVLDTDDGVMAYGYVDEQEGICFLPVRLVSVRSDGKFQVRRFHNEEHEIVLMGKLLQENNMASLSAADNEELNAFAKEINEIVAEENPQRAFFREAEQLDPFRHPILGDPVRVLVMTDDKKFEHVYALPQGEDEDALQGTIVEGPESLLGEELEIRVHEDGFNSFLYGLRTFHYKPEEHEPVEPRETDEDFEFRSVENEEGIEDIYDDELLLEEDEEEPEEYPLKKLKELSEKYNIAQDEEQEALMKEIEDELLRLAKEEQRAETVFVSLDGEASPEDQKNLLEGNLNALSETLIPGFLEFNGGEDRYLTFYTNSRENAQIHYKEHTYRAFMSIRMFIRLGANLDGVTALVIDPYNDFILLRKEQIQALNEKLA